MESYALLIGATLSAGTVLAIAALGLLINEKAGIVNLGAEGMMLCAAIAGFATVVHTGISYVQAKLPELPKYVIPVLGDVPLLGPALFRQHPLVYLTMLLVAGLIWFLYRTRAALALTTFATWRPARVLLGAYLFGGVTMLQFHLQATGVQVASQLLSMLPYVATIVVLALISRNPAWIRINMPASLGKPFYPGS